MADQTRRENALKEIEVQELETLYQELKALQRETEHIHTLTKDNKVKIHDLENQMENMKSGEGRHEEEFHVISTKLHDEIDKYSEKASFASRRNQALQTALARNQALTDVLQRQAEFVELIAEDSEKLLMNLDKVVSATVDNIILTDDLLKLYEKLDKSKTDHLNDLHEIKCKTQAYQMDLVSGFSKRAEKQDQLGLISQEEEDFTLKTSGQDSEHISWKTGAANKIRGEARTEGTPH